MSFGETGFFQRTREQMLIFEGNRETQTIDEHGKRESLIWRNRGTRQLISCKKETSSPDWPHLANEMEVITYMYFSID